MEAVTDRITESLAMTDAEEHRSFSIFDENDNKLCAVGKPKVTEREARTIRQCLKSSWRNSVRIKIGKVNFLCLRVSNILLGHGNFNVPDTKRERRYSEKRETTLKIESCETEKKESECEKHQDKKLTLSAVLVNDLVVIVIGQVGEKDSYMKATKDIADIVNASLNNE